MTTVACKDGWIVSDGMSAMGKMKVHLNLRKVFRLSNGTVVGFAGVVSGWKGFVQELNKAIAAHDKPGSIELPIIKGFKGVEAMLYDGHSVYCWDRGWDQSHKGHWAIGHGSPYALAAMDAGATAEEAVRVAIRRDLCSGGRIYKLEVT